MKLSIIIVILSSFSMCAINIWQSKSHINQEVATELENTAKRVSYYISYSDDARRDILQLAEYEDVVIIVTDREGNKTFVSTYEYDFPEKFDASDYDVVLEGNTTSYTGVFDKHLHHDTISVAYPYIAGNEVEGVIFVVTKANYFNSAFMHTLTVNFVSVGIAILVALIASYFLSKSLVRPLRRMQAGAREISLGRYNQIDCDTKIREYSEVVGTFNKMSTELEKQDRARADFIANISHDLRTPLTTIMGYVRGIMDETIPPSMQNQYLGVALSEAERMQHMIENNLDLSKYERGNFVPNMSSFNLNEIVRSIVITMEKRIREKNIVIDFKYEKSENIVEADESAIYRVVQNLLDNALKFASIGSEIEISITNKNGFAVFSIKNYGSSISEEEQKYIWDRYYKADSSRSYHKKGSGLGLYIVKSIINQHNQEIEIKSDDNSVEFSFTLNLTNC
ncbi:MAG: HAMP domain-containing histidine kinase [Clostridia bacterium]|nr:HAMP domain-containing histidine kinase [Clostridia bacterium]